MHKDAARESEVEIAFVMLMPRMAVNREIELRHLSSSLSSHASITPISMKSLLVDAFMVAGRTSYAGYEDVAYERACVG